MTLANIAASKDLGAFTVLENHGNVSSPAYPVDQEFIGDDESVAAAMQKRYVENGLDPHHAINREDPLADFGGTHSLI